MSSHRTAEAVLHEVRSHPERHRHDYAALKRCCTIGGALNPLVMKAHEGVIEQNVRGKCDVSKGCCSCGAWH